MIRRRLAFLSPEQILPILMSIGLLGVTLLGMRYWFGTGLPQTHAMALMLAPAFLALSILRPAWLVIGILLLPPRVLDVVPAAFLPLLLVLPLAAIVTAGLRASFTWRSGVPALGALLLLALLHPADVSGTGALFASGLFKHLIYYVSLMALTYNAVRLRLLAFRQVLSALLAGIAIASFFELFLGVLGPGRPDILLAGRTYGYVSAMGLLIVIGAFLLDDFDRISILGAWPRWLLAAAGGVMGFLMLVTLLRGAWLGALGGFVIAAALSDKRRWLGATPLVLGVAAIVPAARDRLLPSGLGENTTLVEYTTGRWRLWTEMIDAARPELWAGNGWGWWWSLTPEEIFGVQTFVVEGGNDAFVYPHNDWLLFLVELGVLGVVLLAVFWGQIIVAIRRLARGTPQQRSVAVVLVGVFSVFLLVQLVENGVTVRTVSEPVFVTAGLVLSMASKRRPGRSDAPALDVAMATRA